jgi:hypothetical protein
MKYILVFTCAFTLNSCFRLPLNIYSPAPVNTVTVKTDGDAGINASYFSNGPRHPNEKDLASNGFALQGRAVVSNKWFVEASISNIKELTNGQFNRILREPADLITYKAKTIYNYNELGLGKILNLNSKGSSNLLLSAGYGYTKYNNSFDLASSTTMENVDFNFTNNHIFLNTQFQFNFGMIRYQVGVKNNLINFKRVETNNQFYLGEEENTLRNETVLKHLPNCITILACTRLKTTNGLAFMQAFQSPTEFMLKIDLGAELLEATFL